MRLCRPAPDVARKLPTRMAHSFGQAKFATTSFPPILCPNLSRMLFVLRDRVDVISQATILPINPERNDIPLGRNDRNGIFFNKKRKGKKKQSLLPLLPNGLIGLARPRRRKPIDPFSAFLCSRKGGAQGTLSFIEKRTTPEEVITHKKKEKETKKKKKKNKERRKEDGPVDSSFAPSFLSADPPGS